MLDKERLTPKYRLKIIKMFCQMFDYQISSYNNKCTSAIGDRQAGTTACVFMLIRRRKLQEEFGNNNLTYYMKQAGPMGAKVIVGQSKVTIYFPYMHESGFMPIVDLQVRIVDKKVKYKCFKKPISNIHVILAECALTGGVKRATLTQDSGLRTSSPEQNLPNYTGLCLVPGFDGRCRGESGSGATPGSPARMVMSLI